MEFILLLVALGIFAETTYLTIRALQPSVKAAEGSVLLDTSVLIDGRILSIARSGILTAPLLVPTSVVRELQFMADKADHDKRERARFGLEMIERLQALESTTLTVIDDGETDRNGVDEQLIRLSQKWNAKLCTIDYNLNKSARVQAVEVININELAHALRVTYLPGESLEVKLIQSGQDAHQAVGYLDDGTMVVVDDAKTLIGQTVTIQATRVLQTAAGKMLFAKLEGQKRASKQRQSVQKKTHAAPAQPDTRSAGSRQPSKRRKSLKKTPEDALVDLANS